MQHSAAQCVKSAQKWHIAVQCTLVCAVFSLGGSEDLGHQKWAVPIIKPSLTHSRTGQGAQQHHRIHHFQQEGGEGKKGAE